MNKIKAQKIPKVISVLKDKYNCLTPDFKISVLERIIHFILKEKETQKNAIKAIKLLKEEFVDWNEIRVSGVKEIEDAIISCIKKNTCKKSTAISDMLNHIFQTCHSLNLDFLLEKELNEVITHFEKIETNPAITPTILLQVSLNSSHSITQNCIRVGKRIGLWQETTPSSLSKNITETTTEILPELNAYFYMYGEDFCKSNSYDCKNCVLLNECDFGQKRTNKSTKSAVTTKKHKTIVMKKSQPSTRTKSKK